MPRVQNPPEIAGFTYFYVATTLCSVLPKDSPTKHKSGTNPYGKHKLFSGGYKCTAGRLCNTAYCYDCATKYFGHEHPESLAEYHREFCREQTSTVDVKLKRRFDEIADARDEQTLTEEPLSKSHRLDQSRTPDYKQTSSRSGFGLDSAPSPWSSTAGSKVHSSGKPKVMDNRLPSHKAGTNKFYRHLPVGSSMDKSASTDRGQDEAHAAVRQASPKTFSDDLINGPEPRSDPSTPPTANNSRKKPLPRVKPAAGVGSQGNMRTSRTRKPLVEPYRRAPTHSEFFTAESDGNGSWRFPDDPVYTSWKMPKEGDETSASAIEESWREIQKRLDSAAIGEHMDRMKRIVRKSKSSTKDGLWWNSKRKSKNFKKAQQAVQERRLAWDKENHVESRSGLANTHRATSNLLLRADSGHIKSEDDDSSGTEQSSQKDLKVIDIPGGIVQAINYVRFADDLHGVQATHGALITSSTVPSTIEQPPPTSAIDDKHLALTDYKDFLNERDSPSAIDQKTSH